MLGKEMDGTYAKWQKTDAYAKYPDGESLNLHDFKAAMKGKAITEENLKAAAFSTFTGNWAKGKGFDKVKIVTSLKNNVQSIQELTNFELMFYK